ncbi:cytochrome c oxidase subunit 4 [Planctomonas psychrotolerans]|uniref:cytochrome c oxidase subunit 4 n=1 Tax=Planctomonas psychrotolerans TaxID=2528712 RepID=UPI001239D47B|nr:cytochrome c oxidase subunit 4 [Planctomonas psychrotolerans]
MRANAVLFWILSLFFGVLAVIYPLWGILEADYVEPAGTVALSLTSILGAFVGFYLQKSYNTQGAELPEDRSDANIDDGDPELGFFSPWSWWPIVLAAGGASVMLGIAVGFWIAIIGVFVTVIALVGWTYEYYRGYFAR